MARWNVVRHGGDGGRWVPRAVVGLTAASLALGSTSLADAQDAPQDSRPPPTEEGPAAEETPSPDESSPANESETADNSDDGTEEQPKQDEATDERPEDETASGEDEAASATDQPAEEQPAPLEAGAAPADAGEEAEEPAPRLVARPEESQTTSQPVFPRPAATLVAEKPLDDRVDRRETMPGDVVLRPLTLPRGTMQLGFTQGVVFIDGSDSANAPSFALGITEAIEFGLSAPLTYHQTVEEWVALQPRLHLAATIFDSDGVEMGALAAFTLSTLEDTEPTLLLSVPALFRPHPSWRLDTALQADLGFEKQTQLSFRVPLVARAQLSRGFYTGMGVAGEIGVSTNRTSGADAQVLLGTTYQTHGHAHVDLELQFFLENMGGAEGSVSDGGGMFFSLRFFPELY